jgi:hypothetical protein
MSRHGDHSENGRTKRASRTAPECKGAVTERPSGGGLVPDGVSVGTVGSAHELSAFSTWLADTATAALSFTATVLQGKSRFLPAAGASGLQARRRHMNYYPTARSSSDTATSAHHRPGQHAGISAEVV